MEIDPRGISEDVEVKIEGDFDPKEILVLEQQRTEFIECFSE